MSCKKTENVHQEMPDTSVTDSLMHNLRFEHVSKDEYQLKGFQEVVFSVADLEEASKTYQEVAGWEILYSGVVSATQLAAWQLPDTARAHEMVLHNPGDREGFLRLVQFGNVPQRQIRSSAQPWDAGGIFDINVRIVHMDSTFYELQSRGWNAYHDPVAFKFGKFHVEEVLVRGHDGVVLAMIQRHAPPLEGYPNLKKMSHIFNATQIVTDIDKSLDFYMNGLGFKMYMQHKGASTAPGENVLGLPYNLTDDYERSVCILHPEGTNFGSVELLQFHGISGKDHAAFAVPPHLGILMQRFPVANIAVFSKKIQERGIVIRQPVTTLELPPYGKVKSLAVQTPDGAWLEFIALAD
ncbi:MAG: VOC family protein [Bacteroidota bacterium]